MCMRVRHLLYATWSRWMCRLLVIFHFQYFILYHDCSDLSRAKIIFHCTARNKPVWYHDIKQILNASARAIIVQNMSFRQIWTDPFNLATPREIEMSKFDLMIYYVLLHSKAFIICITIWLCIKNDRS